jgi:ATP-dependent Clp protease protease subunit
MRMQETIRNIIAEHTGQPIEKIAHDTDRDFYLNPKQAMEYGLIDEILTAPAKK